MDGQKLTFAGEFDAVFSNAALHWMRDQEAVLAGVHRALKPGGRFVAEMGGHNNTAAIIVALSAVLARRGLDAHRLSPWYFPSADAYRKKLEAAGFTIDEIAIVPRPTTLPTGIEAVARRVCGGFFPPVARGRPAAGARRGRRAAAARPDGRDRHLDRRLRPAALPRDFAPDDQPAGGRGQLPNSRSRPATPPRIARVCRPTAPKTHFRVSERASAIFPSSRAPISASRRSRYSRVTTASPIVSDSALATSCACLPGTRQPPAVARASRYRMQRRPSG